jgi:hypothetical protein
MTCSEELVDALRDFAPVAAEDVDVTIALQAAPRVPSLIIAAAGYEVLRSLSCGGLLALASILVGIAYACF